MKKTLLMVTAVCMITGLGVLGIAWGQSGSTADAPAQHKVGLIDMAYLFSKYDKFNALREDLRVEIESREAKLKQSAESLKAIAAEMQQLAQGSPDYVAREKKITEIQIQIEADKQAAKREFFRKESKIYQTVYEEVTDMVEKYADYHKYTLIMRFNRDDQPNNDDPQRVMQALQKQVVFFRPEDDITDSVLKVLNRQYSPTASGSASRPGTPKPRTTSKPKPAGTTRN